MLEAHIARGGNDVYRKEWWDFRFRWRRKMETCHSGK